MARSIDLLVTRYDWVTTIADPLAPTVAELTAGAALSIYLTASTKFGAADSDTVSEKGITDNTEIVVPTIQKAEAMLEWFRDLTSGAASANDLSTKFAAANETGYLVRRIGLPYTTAYIAAQKIEIGKFIADQPVYSAGSGSGYLKATTKLLPAGFYKANITVIA